VQAVPQLLTPTSEIVSSQPYDQMPQPNTRQIKRKKPPPPFSMKLRRESLASEPSLPGRAGSGEKMQKIRTTKPNTRGRVDGRNRNGPTINWMHDPNSREKSPAGQDPNARQTPNPGRNQNLRGNRNLGRSPNPEQPNPDQTEETIHAMGAEDI